MSQNFKKYKGFLNKSESLKTTIKWKSTGIKHNKNDSIKKYLSWKMSFIKINFNGNQSAIMLKYQYSKRIKFYKNKSSN